MNFKNIMVPFDGSEHAVNAVKTALQLAGLIEGSKVYVVNIIPAGNLESSVSDYEIYHDTMQHMVDTEKKTLMEKLEGVFGENPTIVPEAFTAFSPVDGISRYVESKDIDLVVMGRRGLSGLRGMLGSVSYGVLHAVDIPVMTVK